MARHGYQEMPHPGFGAGLNLRSQPDRVSPEAAVDVLDCTFTQFGAVKQRAGYGKFTSVEGTNRFDCMSPFYRTGSANQLVVGDGKRLEGLDTAGAIVASSTAPTASPHFFTRFGGPTQEVLLAANGTDQLRQWSGAAWSTPAWTGTAPTGMFLAVTPWDNRVVNARRGGSTAGDNNSSVRFSDPGVPTTWGANNYVDLTPGDGQAITGMAAWENQLFVFKDNKFFTFYGTGTDSTGNPVFSYRPVDAGIGCVSGQAVVTARDGVYFMDRKGVYRTTGGMPEVVSGVLDPFFAGEASSFFQSSTLNHGSVASAAMTWHDEKIWLAVPTGSSSTNDRLLVFDPRHDWWTLYSIPASSLASFRIGNQAELVFSYATGLKHVGRHSSSYTTDDGTNIAARWLSGWADFGSQSAKTVREFKCWGSGKVNVALVTDYETTGVSTVADFTTTADTWGDGTGADTWGDGTGTDVWSVPKALYPKLIRTSGRGTTFSLQLSSSAGAPWSFGRLTFHVREKLIPSKVTV